MISGASQSSLKTTTVEDRVVAEAAVEAAWVVEAGVDTSKRLPRVM